MSPTFFTDRDLGQQFPNILKEAGLSVFRHSELFAPDSRDEEWLERAGAEGWIAVTHDRRIRYKPNERDAVIRHRVGLLVVIGAAPYQMLAANFVATRAKIEAFVAGQERPFIANVYRPSPGEMSGPSPAGRVELWYPR